MQISLLAWEASKLANPSLIIYGALHCVILLANVLQRILHQVLLITRIKIYRHCSTINFTEDYFRQQYPLR